MRSGNQTPCIEIIGAQISSQEDGNLPIIRSGEISDCVIAGSTKITGRRTGSLLISNATFGDAELRISGSYEKIAFVNCTFDQKSVVILSEEDGECKEVLLMGCEYHSPENELLLTERSDSNIDWKREQLWIYDHVVPAEDVDVIRQYLCSAIDEPDFDDEFDMYGVATPECQGEVTDAMELEAGVSWKMSLATLGLAALVGLSGKKSRVQKIRKKEVKHERKEVKYYAQAR